MAGDIWEFYDPQAGGFVMPDGEVIRPEVMPGTPRYHIYEWVDVIAGRRSRAIEKLRPELHNLIVGLVEQLSRHAELHNLDLAEVRFEEIRWTPQGQIVIDIKEGRGTRKIAPED